MASVRGHDHQQQPKMWWGSRGGGTRGPAAVGDLPLDAAIAAAFQRSWGGNPTHLTAHLPGEGKTRDGRLGGVGEDGGELSRTRPVGRRTR